MIRLKYCTVEWTDFGCVTRFGDGSEISAWPHWDDHHYHVIAHRLGYGDDLLAYAREHEFAHSFIAERLMNDRSRVLWDVASSSESRLQMARGFYAYEEMAAQTLQRWLRANERPILAGVDWDALKADALALLAAETVP